MYNFITVAPLIPLFIVIIVIWLDLDPFLGLSKSAILYAPNLCLVVPALRVGVEVLCVLEILRSICGLGIVFLMFLGASTEIILRCKKLIGERGLCPMKVIPVYKELQIWTSYINEKFCYFAVPPIIFFGMGIIILTNYLTIRWFGKVPITLYWVPAFTSFIGFSIVVTIVPWGTQVFESSLLLLEFLRGKCFSKYGQKLIRSLKPVGIQMGPFCTMSRAWLVAIVWNIATYTIHLLLTF